MMEMHKLHIEKSERYGKTLVARSRRLSNLSAEF